ncbi:MAG: methyltransferase domain-containing protein [Chloroflexia bacterium]
MKSFWRSLKLLRTPHLPAQFAIMQDLRVYTRVGYLYAALRSGLLHALRAPATGHELARKLNVQRPELLEALLRVGVSIGELSIRGGRYRVRGARSKALLDPTNDPLAAVIEEFVTYHASVYRHMPERLSGAPLGDYLSGTGDLIARSSRVLEPFMADFVREAATRGNPGTLLEIGCGSGIYIRHAAEANPRLTGMGIDMQEDVVRQARDNLGQWGLVDRFKVVLGDIRMPPPDVGEGYDLVTLYNNVYYFPVEERGALFKTLRALVSPGGSLALLSSMQGTTPLAADFDLSLRSTQGCSPLPRLAGLKQQLQAAGFRRVESTRLVPTEPFYGVIATLDNS